jgi:hypothetical protein
MNPKYLFRLLSLTLIAGLPWLAPAQERQVADDVRDAFLVTRQKVSADKSSKPENPSRTKPRHQIGPIGLGYTLYKRDPGGSPVRVAPSREFHQGDAVRLVIESNIDGYLYVFHTENDGSPTMIFPDARLNSGDNRIGAHVPYEVPSSKEVDPRLRWFIFDDKAATERLYLVITRKPLLGVPIRKELVAYCRTNSGGCPWRPAETAWSQLAAKAEASAREDQSREFGQVQAFVEREAVERGLGLSLDAPAPSVVKMSKSSQAGSLVAMVALIHK